MHKEFRADLHCHSNHSDGTDSPFELLQKAREAQLQGLSITDHDTIDAYTPDFFAEAKRLGIQLLNGVEISSELEGSSVHILAYGFDLKCEKFSQFLREIRKKRGQRNRAILEKLKQHQMPITEEELFDFAKFKTIGRPHIAALMVQKGYVADFKEAFDRYLKEGALCYASGIRFHPKEVIEEIHKAAGKAILAHPHFIKKGAFLRKLLQLPFDGIECYYSRLDQALEIPWLKLAKERNWIATGGSDYHGSFKPMTPLGCSWVSEHIFKALQSADPEE